MGKARAKGPRRKRKPRERHPRRPRKRSSANQVSWIAAIAVVLCALLWVGHTSCFQDRHWSAFKEAGDRAFGRANYAYAQRMYTEALDEAERIDPDGERVVKTLLALSRTHKVLGEQMLSDTMLTRARALRAQRKR